MRLAGIVGGALQKSIQGGDSAQIQELRALQRPVMESLAALNEFDGYIDAAISEAYRRGIFTRNDVREMGLGEPISISIGLGAAILVALAIVTAGTVVYMAWRRQIDSNERIRVAQIEALQQSTREVNEQIIQQTAEINQQRAEQGLAPILAPLVNAPINQDGPEKSPTDKFAEEAAKVVKTIAILGTVLGAGYVGFKTFVGNKQ